MFVADCCVTAPFPGPSAVILLAKQTRKNQKRSSRHAKDTPLRLDDELETEWVLAVLGQLPPKRQIASNSILLSYFHSKAADLGTCRII